MEKADCNTRKDVIVEANGNNEALKAELMKAKEKQLQEQHKDNEQQLKYKEEQLKKRANC